MALKPKKEGGDGVPNITAPDGTTIALFASPKSGCSSAFAMLIQAATDEVGGSWRRGHAFFDLIVYEDRRLRGHAEADIRVAVIRDPVARFVSGYLDRVVKHRHGFEPGETVPTFDEFVDDFANVIRRHWLLTFHFLPQVHFTGRAAFDRIYPVERIDGFADLLSWKFGKTIASQRQNATAKDDKPTPTPAQVEFIRGLYADDYAMFPRYFAD